jgi:hypothetical protein
MISEFSFNSDAKVISPSGEFALESLRLGWHELSKWIRVFAMQVFVIVNSIWLKQHRPNIDCLKLDARMNFHFQNIFCRWRGCKNYGEWNWILVGSRINYSKNHCWPIIEEGDCSGNSNNQKRWNIISRCFKRRDEIF